MKLADHQNAVIKKMNYLESKIDQLKQNRSNLQLSSKEKQSRIEERIKEFQNKLKNVLNEK